MELNITRNVSSSGILDDDEPSNSIRDLVVRSGRGAFIPSELRRR